VLGDQGGRTVWAEILIPRKATSVNGSGESLQDCEPCLAPLPRRDEHPCVWQGRGGSPRVTRRGGHAVSQDKKRR
jgi:hypothetical protein